MTKIHKKIKRIALIGSTGSIGRQTLEVAAAHPDTLEVVALAAGSKGRVLEEQVRRFRPAAAALWDDQAAGDLRTALRDCDVRVGAGMEGLRDIVTGHDVDTVVMAVSGCIGLEPTLEALRAGKQVALANKETLVAAGDLVMAHTRGRRGAIVPVDSEHSAIWQCLRHGSEESAEGAENVEGVGLCGVRSVARLVLTASGGAFRDWDAPRLKTATAADALRHPNWQMGAKITVDSATLMNKGLEVIEAHHLFGMSYEAIDVLVHPQSVIHSMVVYEDGAVLAQLGIPDMRLPIQYALSYPERWSCCAAPGLAGQALTFEEVDAKRFPALALAYECGRRGGLLPAVMNAANEVAVHAFLTGRISYPRLFDSVEHVCASFDNKAALTLENVLQADAWARGQTERVCGGT